MCRMGEATHPIGEGIQFPHLPYLPGKAVDKVSNYYSILNSDFITIITRHHDHLKTKTMQECRHVHGANLSHGASKTSELDQN